jgi:hypothetical protein
MLLYASASVFRSASSACSLSLMLAGPALYSIASGQMAPQTAGRQGPAFSALAGSYADTMFATSSQAYT